MAAWAADELGAGKPKAQRILPDPNSALAGISLGKASHNVLASWPRVPGCSWTPSAAALVCGCMRIRFHVPRSCSAPARTRRRGRDTEGPPMPC